MSYNKIYWFTLATFLLCSMSACEGGDTFIIQRTMPNEFPTNDNVIDEMMAGEIQAGEIQAGEIQAGEIQAGEIIENCGLYSEASIQIFTQAPLDLLTNSCANCHNPESFRRFKLTFDSSDVDTTYSPEQVQEALNSIEPFIIIGNGVGSLLATRIIDGHSNLNFNANAPEYSQMVTWIDSLINCN